MTETSGVSKLDVHRTFMATRIAAVTLAHIVIMNVFCIRARVIRLPRLPTLAFFIFFFVEIVEHYRCLPFPLLSDRNVVVRE